MQPIEEAARRFGYSLGYNYWAAFLLLALVAVAVWAYRRQRR